MRFLVSAALLAATSFSTATSLAGDGTQAVTFILDCSQSMGAKISDGNSVVQTSSNRTDTRLDAGKQAILTVLDKLSVDGDHRVGLILYGQRLAWQPGVTEPDLMEQTQYLEQTLGFEALKELVPGDDVEIVRHLGRFEPRDFTMLQTRFNALQPWGEKPLYLALQKAVDTFERSAADRRVIVITDGGNDQGMAKHKTTKDQLMEAIDRRPVPIYIFRLGDEDIGRQAEAELAQIARRSNGDYLTIADAAELGKQVQKALAVRASRNERTEKITQTASTNEAVTVSDAATADAIKSALATIKSGHPAAEFSRVPGPPTAEELKTARLQGSVSYYGMPAKRAKIILEGEATQLVLRTDSQGNFSVEDVEPGIYTLWTEATVKNTIRYASRKLKIDNSGRTKTIDLDLQ